MRTASILASAAVLVASGVASAQIVSYDLTGQPGGQVTTPASTATVATGLTVGDIVRGPGTNPTNLVNGMSANQWSNNDPAGDDPSLPVGSRDDALANGDFFGFDVSVDPLFVASFSTVQTSLRRSGLGAPESYEWQYSLDGFATPGTTLVQFNYFGRASGTAPGTIEPFAWMSQDVAGQNAGNPTPEFDISGFDDLQDVQPESTVSFRLYVWGADRDSRTVALGRFNGPTLGGNVELIPEPAAAGLLGLGGLFALARRRR